MCALLTITATTFHFLRVNAQMRNLDKQKTTCIRHHDMRTLIFFTLLVLLNIPQTFACDCLDAGGVTSEVKRNSIVAVVRTISQDTVQFTDEFGHIDYKWEYKFVVLRKYKGQTTSDTIFVSSPYGETACGFFFKINHEYILYGTRWTSVKRKPVQLPDNHFTTTICTRTKAIDLKEEAAIKAATKE